MSMEFMTAEQASDYVLMHCNSYSRFPTLLNMADRVIDDDGNVSFSAWLKVLGENWSVCDNIGKYTEELTDILWTYDRTQLQGKPKRVVSLPCPEMMDSEEQALFDSLPETVVIYRGCYDINKWGLSWSLNRDVAAKFPFLGRYWRRNEQALLVKARVSKSNIMAVCLGRNEHEIITYNPTHISTSHLKDPDAFDKGLCAAHAVGGAV